MKGTRRRRSGSTHSRHLDGRMECPHGTRDSSHPFRNVSSLVLGPDPTLGITIHPVSKLEGKRVVSVKYFGERPSGLGPGRRRYVRTDGRRVTVRGRRGVRSDPRKSPGDRTKDYGHDLFKTRKISLYHESSGNSWYGIQ